VPAGREGLILRARMSVKNFDSHWFTHTTEYSMVTGAQSAFVSDAQIGVPKLETQRLGQTDA